MPTAGIKFLREVAGYTIQHAIKIQVLEIKWRIKTYQ
jgi:hypothetical protein